MQSKSEYRRISAQSHNCGTCIWKNADGGDFYYCNNDKSVYYETIVNPKKDTCGDWEGRNND